MSAIPPVIQAVIRPVIGNVIDSGDISLKPSIGWTGSISCAGGFDPLLVTVKYSVNLTVTDGTGVVIDTPGGKVFTVSSASVSAAKTVSYVGSWSVDPVAGEVINFSYTQPGNHLDTEVPAVEMEDVVDKALQNCQNTPPTALGLADQNDPVRPALSLPTAGSFDAGAGSGLFYSATGLPPGLSINSGTGEITGDPDDILTVYNCSVTLATSYGSATNLFDWTIVAAVPLWQGDPLPPQNPTEGQAVTGFELSSRIIDVGGDPNIIYSIEIGSDPLPLNLILDPNTGTISGIIDVNAQGIYNMIYGATNSAGKSTTTQVVTVTNTIAPAEWTALPILNILYTDSEVIDFPLINYVQNNGAASHIELFSGSLPASLSIDANDHLVGTIAVGEDINSYNPVYQIVTPGVGVSATNETQLVKGVNSDPIVFFAPLTHYLTPDIGIGSYVFTRNSGGTVHDFEGLIKTCLVNEARFQDVRRVENLFTDSTDSLAISAATTAVDVGVGIFVFSMGAGGGTATYSGTSTGHGSGTLAADAANRTADTITITVAGTLIITASVAALVDFQLEDVTGQTVQDPSEYVSVGVGDDHGSNVDGVKYFPYHNLNRAVANVIQDNGIGSTFGRQVENLLDDTDVYDTNEINIPVVIGQDYILSCSGTGTLEVQDAYAGSIAAPGAAVREQLLFTATTATLDTVISGSVTEAQLEVDDGLGVAGEYVKKGVDVFPFSGTGHDGVAEFSTTNPNDVNLNVVTADLTTYPVTPGDGVLIEGPRTNEVKHSTDLTDASWIKTGYNSQIDSDAFVAPDGGAYTTSKLAEDATGGAVQHRMRQADIYFDAIDTTVIHSFAAPDERDTFTIREATTSGRSVTFELVGQGSISTVNATGTIELLDSGIYKCTAYIIQNSGSGNKIVDFHLNTNGGTANESYIGTQGNGLFLWGIQIEELGNTPSSYIPTVGSPVVRGADELSYDNANMVLEPYSWNISFTPSIVQGSGGIYHRYMGTTSWPTRVFVGMESAGVARFYRLNNKTTGAESAQTTNGMTTGELATICTRADAASIAIVMNGGAISSVANNGSGNNGDPLTLDGRVASGGGNNVYGAIKDVRIYNEALSDDKMKELSKVESD